MNGYLLSYDVGSSTWSAETSPTVESLHAIWGTSASNVYAVGDGGTILHYDGTVWEAVESGVSDDLFGLWGASADLIFASGGDGTVLRYEGDGSTGDNNTSDCPLEVAVSGADDLRLLRALRDNHLNTVTIFNIPQLYYDHAEEASARVRTDTVLNDKLQKLVDDNRETMKTLLARGTASVDTEQIEAVQEFLSELKEGGSRNLRCAAGVVQHGIENRWLLDVLGIIVEE